MNSQGLLQLKDTIQSVLGSDFPVTIDVPATQAAWLAVPVFAVAKQTGEAVPVLAENVAARVREAMPDVVVTVAGGYINIMPTPERAAAVLREALAPSYGRGEAGDGRTVVIDYSSPNIAKPMSIGHLRSTIIGDSLRRLHEFQGFRVVSINYLGDWGTQYGKLVVAYHERFGDLEPRPSLTVTDLFNLYVQYHRESEENAALDEEARAMFKRLEDGDPAITKLWQFFVDRSHAEFQALYRRLDVSFSAPKMGESTHRVEFTTTIDLVRSQGIAQTSEGAVVVRIPGIDAPLMLQKRDGATTYATRDLTALRARIRQYHPSEVLYVVSNEQTLHFEQVFAVARMVGIAPDSVSLVHVKFGHLRLPEGKMSTRRGRVIFLDSVMKEAVAKALAIVQEKQPELAPATQQTIAEAVGIGALKYFDLAHDRNHDIVFDWERMLSLKGDSAPYLQYTVARARGILKKQPRGKVATIAAVPVELFPITYRIAQFPQVSREATEDRAPHRLAQYLNELATVFHSFYEQYPVLVAHDADRPARLAVVLATERTMVRGLELLGIAAPESM